MKPAARKLQREIKANSELIEFYLRRIRVWKGSGIIDIKRLQRELASLVVAQKQQKKKIAAVIREG